MAGNSKPRKKYDPSKRFKRIDNMAAGATHNVAATIIAKTSSMTGDNLDGMMAPRDKRDMIAIETLAGLGILRDRWCPAAFRSLTHWYRVLNYLGQMLERSAAMYASNTGKRALDELAASTADRPALSDSQYRNLRLMVLELLETLNYTPAKTLVLGQMESRRRFVDALAKDYRSRPVAVRGAMTQIIKGASVASCVPATMPDAVFREQVKEVGWILHGLMPSSCLYKMPESLAELRALRRPLLPLLEQLEAETPRAIAVDEQEERAAA